jgi:drug/metabolite transporter (DMT)-like permease
VTQGAPLRAAFWMIGTITSFTMMAVAGRELGAVHDSFEIMTFRSILGLLIVLGIGYYAGTLGQISRRTLHLHFARNICHFAGQNLWLIAVVSTPLALVFALEFTTPIWVTLLAPFFLGERITRMRAFTAILGFIGILIVARPGSGIALTPGVIAGAAAAIGFAGSVIFTRRLTRTETITCILFYLTAMQAVFGLICAGYDGQVTWPTLQTLPLLTVVGVAGLLAHFCLTKALSIAPATVVMPIDFARLPIIAIVGMLLYNEPLEWAVLFGAIVIVFSNYINIRAENRAIIAAPV